MKISLFILMLFVMLLLGSIPLCAISVTGTVAGSDSPVVGLSDAAIVLEGDINYSAITNALGQFTITNVAGNATYVYTVTHEGYSPATGNINIGAFNFHMGIIILNEIANPPQNVQAVEVPPNAVISWFPPLPGNPLIDYRIWRLHEGEEQNEAVWHLLSTGGFFTTSPFTDTGWTALPAGTYKWAVKAVYTGGVLSVAAFSNPLEKVVSNPDNPPTAEISVNCSPNPFRNRTNINYSLKDTSPVRLVIYNGKGQKVRTLVDETKSAGNYHAEWNCTDKDNQKTGTGIYFYKLTAGTFTLTGKMILVK